MPLYDYVCTQCAQITADQYFPIKEPSTHIQCPQCGGLARKILAFPAIKRSMGEHYNASLGRHVSNEKDYKSGLAAASRLASARSGREVNYSPVDLRDRESVGVTEEGLDSTRRAEVALGKREAKKYL